MQLGINFHLLNEKFGRDISIKKVTKVNNKFNARFSAKKKLYQYLIFNSYYRSPILHNKSWWVRKEIDINKIIEASKYFLGCHNFSSFRATGCQAQSPTRTIENIKIIKEKNLIEAKFFSKIFFV